MALVPTRRANGAHNLSTEEATKAMYRAGRAGGHANARP